MMVNNDKHDVVANHNHGRGWFASLVSVKSVNYNHITWHTHI